MPVTFVTSNAHKLAEVRAAFAPWGIPVRWGRKNLREIQSDSLRDVVRAKLSDASSFEGAVLVEDTGLFLEGLRGFPGVYSQYAYQTVGLAGILQLIGGGSRAGSFRTIMGLRLGRAVHLTEGTVHGTIARRPRGSRGWGYDPIFIPAGERRTFGEMSPEEKSARSHRGQAARRMARFLGRATRARAQ